MADFFVQSVYPCDEGTYWVTAYPSAFADGATYAFIRDVYYYMDPDALVYTGSKGECVPCPAGTVGVANTGNYTKDWCLPAPEGTTKIIVLLSIFIGVLVGVLLTWQLVKWTMSKARARRLEMKEGGIPSNATIGIPSKNRDDGSWKNGKALFRLCENFMLIADFVLDILTYIVITSALTTIDKEGVYVDSGSVLLSEVSTATANANANLVNIKVNCLYDTNEEYYYYIGSNNGRDEYLMDPLDGISGYGGIVLRTELIYNQANLPECSLRNDTAADNATFYNGAVLPFFILLVAKEGLKVIYFLVYLLNEKSRRFYILNIAKRRSASIQYVKRNVMVLPLIGVFGFDFFRDFFLDDDIDSARSLILDVLLENVPQLIINLIFMVRIRSTGSVINQVSLFFTLSMLLVALVRGIKRGGGASNKIREGDEKDATAAPHVS